jgi:hypothetical protein
LRKIAENCGKLRKIAEHCRKLRKIAENCGTLRKIAGNCKKAANYWGRISENYGRLINCRKMQKLWIAIPPCLDSSKTRWFARSTLNKGVETPFISYKPHVFDHPTPPSKKKWHQAWLSQIKNEWHHAPKKIAPSIALLKKKKTEAIGIPQEGPQGGIRNMDWNGRTYKNAQKCAKVRNNAQKCSKMCKTSQKCTQMVKKYAEVRIRT